MRRFFLALCLLAAFPLSVHAQETPAPDKPAVRKLNGTLSKVQYVMSYIVVISEEGYVTFKVDGHTQIQRGTKKVDLDELDPEDSVSVTYTVDASSGERTALSVRDSTVKRSY